jgi:hypothetical protein
VYCTLLMSDSYLPGKYDDMFCIASMAFQRASACR